MIIESGFFFGADRIKSWCLPFFGFFLVPAKNWFFCWCMRFSFGAHFFWILFWCTKNVSFKKFDDFIKFSMIFLFSHTVFCCTYNRSTVQHTTLYTVVLLYIQQYVLSVLSSAREYIFYSVAVLYNLQRVIFLVLHISNLMSDVCRRFE